jgi:hypothetical protein
MAACVARATTRRMRRIGVLMGYPEDDLEGPAFFAAFREGLEKLGWVENRNIRFETRWAAPEDAEARQRFAKELVALQPDLILSAVTPTTAALLEQTRTIPIVFALVADPVGSGFVASLARQAATPARSQSGDDAACAGYTEWNQGAENRAHRHANFGLAGWRPEGCSSRSTRNSWLKADALAQLRISFPTQRCLQPPDLAFGAFDHLTSRRIASERELTL